MTLLIQVFSDRSRLLKIFIIAQFIILCMTIVNWTSQEWLYLACFGLIILIFRKNRIICSFGIMVICVSLIFQLNEFLPAMIATKGSYYWGYMKIINTLNIIIFIGIFILWVSSKNLVRMRAVLFDEFGLAVLGTVVILLAHFVIRFNMMGFEVRELLFLMQIMEAGVGVLILRDLLILQSKSK